MVRFGVPALCEAFDSVELNVLVMLLTQIWLRDVVKILHVTQQKLCAIARTDIAGVKAIFLEEPYLQLWRTIISTNVALADGIVVEDGEANYDAHDNEV